MPTTLTARKSNDYDRICRCFSRQSARDVVLLSITRPATKTHALDERSKRRKYGHLMLETDCVLP